MIGCILLILFLFASFASLPFLDKMEIDEQKVFLILQAVCGCITIIAIIMWGLAR